MSGVLRWSSPWRIHGTNGIFTYMKTIKSSLFCREIYHAWMVWVGGGNSHIFFYSGRKSLPKNQRLPVGDFPVFSPNFENPPKSSRKLYSENQKKGGGRFVSAALVPKDSGDDCCHQGLKFQFFHHQSTNWLLVFSQPIWKICVVKIGFIIPEKENSPSFGPFLDIPKGANPKRKGFFLGFWHHFWCQQNVRFKSRGWVKMEAVSTRKEILLLKYNTVQEALSSNHVTYPTEKLMQSFSHLIIHEPLLSTPWILQSAFFFHQHHVVYLKMERYTPENQHGA